MPKPRRGEVWLVRFPFTDLTSSKVRPALIVAIHKDDVIVLGIFSRTPATPLPDTWVQIEEQHPSFSQTGLKKTSVLKAEKVAVIHQSVLHRKLGDLPPTLLHTYKKPLRRRFIYSRR
jgi:mRNA interferase MazF